MIAAAGGSAAAALLHIGAMVRGAEWFRLLGAGEAMARAVEHGRPGPYLITTGIALVLLIWSWLALAAAGLTWRPPLLRLGLVAVTALLLVRGVGGLFPQLWGPEHGRTFQIVSSLAVLALGLLFLVGTVRAWPQLSTRS